MHACWWISAIRVSALLHRNDSTSDVQGRGLRLTLSLENLVHSYLWTESKCGSFQSQRSAESGFGLVKRHSVNRYHVNLMSNANQVPENRTFYKSGSSLFYPSWMANLDLLRKLPNRSANLTTNHMIQFFHAALCERHQSAADVNECFRFEFLGNSQRILASKSQNTKIGHCGQFRWE